MLKSFREFKFYQSFRVPVEADDDIRFLLEKEEEVGQAEYVEDAKLLDISSTGLAFSSVENISTSTGLNISLQFKKIHLDLTGTIVRSFHDSENPEQIVYGVELDEDKSIYKFLDVYIHSFSSERLKDALLGPIAKEGYSKVAEGFEMFSLLLSLFKDLSSFGDKEGFVDNMLEEVVRLMEAQRATVFLINPETNQLEAHAALGVNKDKLKFDYRMGIAGSVFTTGVALNIDVINDKSRFNDDFDVKLGYETKSIICYPIHNRDDKVIGVVEILNKRHQERFTVEDEKTMKVLSLVFSSIFHGYTPLSESSQIRRFSTPFDRKYALIGKDPHIGSLRSAIVKLKDTDSPVLIHGERGVGKSLYGQILHHEGQRGLKPYEVIDCQSINLEDYEEELFHPESSKLVKCKGGTLLIRNINQMPNLVQKRLIRVLNEGGLEGDKVSLDARIVSTTTEDLDQLSAEGHFDRDLFKYLSTGYVTMNPLRRRIKDLKMLLEYFLKIECQKQGLLLKSFSDKAIEKLMTHDWPGNIEELKICIQRAVLYNPKSHLITEVEMENTASPLFDVNIKKRMFGDLPFVSDHSITLKDRVAIVEREMILSEIRRNNGNKSKAAKEMGISREALRKKLIISDSVLDKLDETGSEDQGHGFKLINGDKEAA